MVRLLRPLRLVSRNEGLRISMHALVVAIPVILNLLVLVILFMFVFAIFGVNLFRGQLRLCDTAHLISLSNT